MLHRNTLGFFGYFFRAYPGRSIAMVVLLIFAGVAEGFGVLTLLPVLEVAVGSDEDPSGISVVVTRLLEAVGLPTSLGVLLTVIVVAITVKGLFRWMAMKQVGYAVAQVATDLRLRLLRALMAARWSFFTRRPTGHLANAVGTEAHRASSAYREACSGIAGLMELLAYFVVVVLISWEVALFAFIVGLIVIRTLRWFVLLSRKAGDNQTALKKALIGRLTEALPGIKPVKAMGRENHLLPLLEEETRDFNRAQQQQVFASESMRSFHEPILVLALCSGLFVALTWTDEPFSNILVLAFIFYRFMATLNNVQRQYQTVVLGESAFWSLYELVQDAESAEEEKGGRVKPPKLEKGIRFEEVTFAYDSTPVLSGVDLFIPAGRFVAIIGASGAGKTTLVDLLCGLNRPQRGEIYLDDVPMRDVSIVDWRRRIGYVPQETLLFNESIYRNVTLGGEGVSRERVQATLAAAGAWEFVAKLPYGMDHQIGERGSTLSGGQRQRIAIARALLGEPELVILDEATAALDPVTEQGILETLRQLRDRVTLVAISHQTAVQEAADVVYDIVDGEVVGDTDAVQRDFAREPR